MTWELDGRRISQFQRRYKKFAKSKEQEVLNCFENLQRVLDGLNEGASLGELVFLHKESQGLFACDQHGPGKVKKELRLYFYPDEDEERIYVLQIGDKSTQQEDIKVCRELIASIRADASESDTD